MKKILLCMHIALSLLTACGFEQTFTSYDDIVRYKKYNEYSARGFYDVPLDLENVVKSTKEADLQDYEFYYSKYGEEFNDVAKTVDVFEEIKLNLVEPIAIDNNLVNIRISYGAYISEAKITLETDELYDVFYFPEPLIGVHFISADDDTKFNILYYSLDGELAGESEKWFLDDEANRDELAEFYFNEALRIIGKD